MTNRDDLRRRIDAIESAYEFLLAYAAQGLPTDAGSKPGAQVRDELRHLAAGLDGLAEAFSLLVDEESIEPRDRHLVFNDVLAEDADKALAAVELVSAQRAISSQLVDNLNASIHLRALLTDVFLVDEMLKVLGSETPAATQPPEPDA